jgi:organic hydroperoxide reductase OsmC/OhrA
MDKKHSYQLTVTWTGNSGAGTSSYKSYERSFDVSAEGKALIGGSADAAFRGDKTRWNPEEFLVAALSACHQLAYLHLCAEAGVVVTGYIDEASGTMVQTADGGGHFTGVTVRPRVTVTAESDKVKATALHEAAHEKCFIANSVNFPVGCEASVTS